MPELDEERAPELGTLPTKKASVSAVKHGIPGLFALLGGAGVYSQVNKGRSGTSLSRARLDADDAVRKTRGKRPDNTLKRKLVTLAENNPKTTAFLAALGFGTAARGGVNTALSRLKTAQVLDFESTHALPPGSLYLYEQQTGHDGRQVLEDVRARTDFLDWVEKKSASDVRTSARKKLKVPTASLSGTPKIPKAIKARVAKPTAPKAPKAVVQKPVTLPGKNIKPPKVKAS